MTTIRPCSPADISKLNLCNLDPLTENYARSFYFDYLAKWPSMFIVAENQKGQIVAYGVLALCDFCFVDICLMTYCSHGEGRRRPGFHQDHGRQVPTLARPCHCSHGCTAVPPNGPCQTTDRPIGSGMRAGARLVHGFVCASVEQDSHQYVQEDGVSADHPFDSAFRPPRWMFILPLSRYSVFRRVVGYYSDDPTGKGTSEDAFDMRKSLSRDKKKRYIRENGENYPINPEDIYHG